MPHRLVLVAMTYETSVPVSASVATPSVHRREREKLPRCRDVYFVDIPNRDLIEGETPKGLNNAEGKGRDNVVFHQ